MLYEINSESMELNETLNPTATAFPETKSEQTTRKYFECFADDVNALPADLRNKCRREIQSVIFRYENIAEERLHVRRNVWAKDGTRKRSL